MTAATSPHGEIRGWHVLAGILAFFGIVIGVNAVFMVFALRTFPGEDVPRSYLQGLHYNETLAARRAQTALGWSVGVTPEDNRVVVAILDAAGMPVSGLTIEGALRRPVDARHDIPLAFEPLGDGRYAATAAPSSGVWEIRATARRDDDAYAIQQRLEWPSRN